MDKIDESIGELRETATNLLITNISPDVMEKIDRTLDEAKNKLLKDLRKYDEIIKRAEEESEKMRIKQEYVNFLKSNIFMVLNNHVPIGSDIYDADYMDEIKLTPDQQIALYENVFAQLNVMLSELKGSPQINNNLLSELALAIYTWGTSKLVDVTSNLAGQSLKLSKRTIAVVTSLEFLYNYLPSNVRSSLEDIPYIGNMFRIANHIQPTIVGVQSTIAVSASIYIALRSGGIDPQPFINNVLNNCRSTGKRVRNSTISAISDMCSNILAMFGIRFDDEIVIELSQYAQTIEPSQIPILSYISYKESQKILSQDLSANRVVDDLSTLLTQLNGKLNQLESEVNETQRKSFTPPSLPSSSSQGSVGGRRRRRQYKSAKKRRISRKRASRRRSRRRYRR